MVLINGINEVGWYYHIEAYIHISCKTVRSTSMLFQDIDYDLFKMELDSKCYVLCVALMFA